MAAESFEIKVRCDAHPSKSTTIVGRVTVVRRLPDCNAVWLSITPPGAPAPSGAKCQDFIILDRQRPAELCAICAGSSWRIAMVGSELLVDDAFVGGPRAVTGGVNEVPNEELHRQVRYRYRFSCPRCKTRSADIELRHETADAIFTGLAEVGRQRVLLRELAAIVNSNRR
jgi:hypothetical protein